MWQHIRLPNRLYPGEYSGFDGSGGCGGFSTHFPLIRRDAEPGTEYSVFASIIARLFYFVKQYRKKGRESLRFPSLFMIMP